MKTKGSELRFPHHSQHHQIPRMSCHVAAVEGDTTDPLAAETVGGDGGCGAAGCGAAGCYAAVDADAQVVIVLLLHCSVG